MRAEGEADAFFTAVGALHRAINDAERLRFDQLIAMANTLGIETVESADPVLIALRRFASEARGVQRRITVSVYPDFTFQIPDALPGAPVRLPAFLDPSLPMGRIAKVTMEGGTLPLRQGATLRALLSALNGLVRITARMERTAKFEPVLREQLARLRVNDGPLAIEFATADVLVNTLAMRAQSQADEARALLADAMEAINGAPMPSQPPPARARGFAVPHLFERLVPFVSDVDGGAPMPASTSTLSPTVDAGVNDVTETQPAGEVNPDAGADTPDAQPDALGPR